MWAALEKAETALRVSAGEVEEVVQSLTKTEMYYLSLVEQVDKLVRGTLGAKSRARLPLHMVATVEVRLAKMVALLLATAMPLVVVGHRAMHLGLAVPLTEDMTSGSQEVHRLGLVQATEGTVVVREGIEPVPLVEVGAGDQAGAVEMFQETAVGAAVAVATMEEAAAVARAMGQAAVGVVAMLLIFAEWPQFQAPRARISACLVGAVFPKVRTVGW